MWYHVQHTMYLNMYDTGVLGFAPSCVLPNFHQVEQTVQWRKHSPCQWDELVTSLERRREPGVRIATKLWVTPLATGLLGEVDCFVKGSLRWQMFWSANGVENSADLADPLFCKCTPVELKSALQPSGWKEYSVLGGVDWCQTARHLEGGRRGRLLTMILCGKPNNEPTIWGWFIPTITPPLWWSGSWLIIGFTKLHNFEMSLRCSDFHWRPMCHAFWLGSTGLVNDNGSPLRDCGDMCSAWFWGFLRYDFLKGPCFIRRWTYE